MAKTPKSHLFLNNEFYRTNTFNISRGSSDDQNSSVDVDPQLYASQKLNFFSFKEQLISNRKERFANRKLEVPSHIEYLKVYFFRDFDESLRNEFETKFGLVPVFYQDLNQTITLAINNKIKFRNFLEQLDLFINSSDFMSPKGKSYSILITISKFEFLTSNAISNSTKEGNVVLQLVDGLRIIDRFSAIQDSLKYFLDKKNYEWNYIYDDLIEIKNISQSDYDLLTDNFDIIEGVTSFKLFNRHPGLYGESLTSQYELAIDADAPLVGVIDTGISNIGVLQGIIVDLELDLTDKANPKTYLDETGHGTSVAGLVAYGKQLYNENDKITNDARIVPIKVMSKGEDVFSISDLISSIRFSYQNGVRIFSLSINEIRIKRYNEDISHYAFLLDKLSYELDILIFISSGNLDRELVKEYFSKPLFDYPNHFFNPECSEHDVEGYDCSETNICSPADSMNNITVGAIAENFEDNLCDVSLDKSLPAYYSKKWHMSSNFPVNGAKRVKKSQFNNKIFKPDILNPGGDMLSAGSGMKVISNDVTEPFFNCAGSSLSAPLSANLAARILKLYPNLKMQTVKALIINSSQKINLDNLDSFKDLILNIKRRHAPYLIGRTFTNLEELTTNEKTKLSTNFSLKQLEKSLTGNGVPNDDIALLSNSDRITLVYEKTVKVGNYHGFNVNLPDYICKLASNSISSVFKVSITLAYKFEPIYGNSLAYNPLHISFNVLNDFNENLERTLELVSARGPGHQTAFYKNGLQWSDDFYPLNSKPFSNSQKIERTISKKDLLKLVDNFVVVVRCNSKSSAIEEAKSKKLTNNNHEFSMVVTIEEIEKNGKTTGNLYDGIATQNIVESIITLDADLELTL